MACEYTLPHVPHDCTTIPTNVLKANNRWILTCFTRADALSECLRNMMVDGAKTFQKNKISQIYFRANPDGTVTLFPLLKKNDKATIAHDFIVCHNLTSQLDSNQFFTVAKKCVYFTDLYTNKTGVAYCSYDDDFNLEIGKVIAWCRAYNFPIPEELLK